MAHEHIAESSIKYHSSVSYSQFIAAKETTPFTIPTSTTGFANSDTWVNGSDLNNWSKSHNGAKLFRSKKTFYETIYGQDNDNVIAGAAEYDVSWMSNTDFREGIEHGARRTWTWDGVLDETIYGGGGNDIIYGYKGDDHLYGEEDNDILFGGDGDDTLRGNEGNDVLYTGVLTNGESDVLFGGDGGDTFFLGDARNTSDVGGFDWEALALNVAGDASDLFFTIVPGLGTIGKITKEIVPAIFDVLKATSTDVIAPGAGSTGSATIKDFNPAEDVIFIPLPSSGDIHIDQGGGNELLKIFHDDVGADIIATVELDPELYGLEGYDSGRMIPEWYDIVQSNALILDSNGAKDYKNKLSIDIDPSDVEDLGTERFLVLGAYSGVETAGGNGADYEYGTQHNDVIAGYENAVSAYTAGDDVLYGFEGDDEFAGGQGTDRIYGGDGSDTSNYSHSPNGIKVTLSTNQATDDGFGTVDTFDSIENIVGSEYDDSIIGDDNGNIITGQGSEHTSADSYFGGDDTIKGEGGNDTIHGGEGDDLIYGGEGDDSLIGGKDYNSDGNDTIYGDKGDDYIHGGDLFDLLYGGGGNDTMYGGSDNDTLNGNDGEDYMHGGYGNDYLFGNNHNDTLIGGQGGADYLNGGWLNDLLIGGNGNDTLDGGKDSDTMTGDSGADTFILSNSTGTDTITDFDSTEGDIVDIETSKYGFSSVSDLSYNSTTGELKVSTTGTTIVTLENPVDFTADDIYLDGIQNTDPFLEDQDIVIGEYGTIDALEIDWQTINLDNTYVNPVVITSDPTYNGVDVAAIRLRNVDSDSFEVRILEPDYYTDNYHAGETVSYFVVEAGEWELNDGTRINAGLHNTDNLVQAQSDLDTVDFTDNGLTDFSSTPTVLSQVQTFNGNDWVVTRVDGQSQTGFQVGMQEEEALNSGTHATESIGWLAIEDGASFDSSGDLLLQGGTTGAQVEENFTTINYSQSFDVAPTLIAKMASFDGTDPSVLRIDENSLSSTTGFEAFVQEDTSLDTETDHALESVSYLGFNGSEGLLTGLAI